MRSCFNKAISGYPRWGKPTAASSLTHHDGGIFKLLATTPAVDIKLTAARPVYSLPMYRHVHGHWDDDNSLQHNAGSFRCLHASSLLLHAILIQPRRGGNGVGALSLPNKLVLQMRSSFGQGAAGLLTAMEHAQALNVSFTGCTTRTCNEVV